MKKEIIVLFILLFSQSVSGLNDINISMDSGSVVICLSEKQLMNQTCNMTSPLILDGSKDHSLYFTPKYEVKTSDNFYDNVKNYAFYFVRTPIHLAYSVIFFVGIMWIGVYIAEGTFNYIKRRTFH